MTNDKRDLSVQTHTHTHKICYLFIYPLVLLLDLGSNTGPYTLLGAALNHSVISVDPIIRNQGLLFNSLGKFFTFFKKEIIFSKNVSKY